MALITPQTQSTIEGPGGRNVTRTAISTNIVIRVGLQPVGAVQTLSITEKRTITPIDEVGTDGHIDSVPTKSTDINGTCKRIRFDRVRIAEAFSRGFLHVKSQRIPFDIDIYDKWNGDGDNVIITTIKNVWIESIGYSYGADSWLISEDMSWIAEDISSTLKGGLAANKGFDGVIKSLETDIAGIERETDQGKRRGALDAPGLVTSVFGNF